MVSHLCKTWYLIRVIYGISFVWYMNSHLCDTWYLICVLHCISSFKTCYVICVISWHRSDLLLTDQSHYISSPDRWWRGNLPARLGTRTSNLGRIYSWQNTLKQRNHPCTCRWRILARAASLQLVCQYFCHYLLFHPHPSPIFRSASFSRTRLC